MVHTRTTSRSRLWNRVVRVDRNRPLDDGMGGTTENFVTIAERYHVTIWPAQHQQRLRDETGQIETNPTHFAHADPSINGRTIMIGDRFVDEVNNQSWDVLAVERPKAHAYAAVHRFELRLRRDDPPAVS